VPKKKNKKDDTSAFTAASKGDLNLRRRQIKAVNAVDRKERSSLVKDFLLRNQRKGN
jgi:hypothetical protein